MAQFAEKYLHEYITSQKAYREGDIQKAMEQGFLELDKVLKRDTTSKMTGSTAIVVLIKDNILYSVNMNNIT